MVKPCTFYKSELPSRHIGQSCPGMEASVAIVDSYDVMEVIGYWSFI